MFDFEYKGGNGIVITSKKVQLVIDPNLAVVGLKNLSAKDAIELSTESRLAVNDSAARLHVEGPGEYEVGDVSIRGIRATRHIDTEMDEPISTIYRIDIGEVRMAVLGNISPKLSEDQLEEIGVIDILVIPVGGGGYTLDATSAVALARQIDANVVIPVHYADSALKYEVPQETVDVFINELAAPVEDAGLKYKVKSASSVPSALTVIKVGRS